MGLEPDRLDVLLPQQPRFLQPHRLWSTTSAERQYADMCDDRRALLRSDAGSRGCMGIHQSSDERGRRSRAERCVSHVERRIQGLSLRTGPSGITGAGPPADGAPHRSRGTRRHQDIFARAGPRPATARNATGRTTRTGTGRTIGPATKSSRARRWAARSTSWREHNCAPSRASAVPSSPRGPSPMPNGNVYFTDVRARPHVYRRIMLMVNWSVVLEDSGRANGLGHRCCRTTRHLPGRTRPGRPFGQGQFAHRAR